MSAEVAQGRDALLINRIILRGPEMELLHRYLLQGRWITRDEILSRFVPASREGGAGREDTVVSALDALSTLGLLRTDQAGRYQAQPLPPTLPFAATLLIALRKLTGRQSGILDLYSWCISASQHLLAEEALLDEARRHVPGDAGWTPQKIGFWAALGEFVGIVTGCRSSIIMISPNPAALRVWLADRLGGRERWAGEVFAEIAERFAPCFTSDGALHPGWAGALGVLQAQGLVRLELGSDAPVVLHATVGTGRVWSRISLGAATANVGRS